MAVDKTLSIHGSTAAHGLRTLHGGTDYAGYVGLHGYVSGGGGSAPSAITTSQSSFADSLKWGAGLGSVSASGAGPIAYSLDDNASGWAEVTSSGTLRLLGLAGSSNKTIVIRATNAYGSTTQSVTFTCSATTMPSGLFAKWDTSAGITQAGGKVSKWIDQISGYELEQTTGANQPAWDTTNTLNGYNAVTFAQASTTRLPTNSAAVNAALKSMIDADQASFTVLAVIVDSTVDTDLCGWGSATRNYAMVRPVGGNMKLYLGDDVDALTQVGIASSGSTVTAFTGSLPDTTNPIITGVDVSGVVSPAASTASGHYNLQHSTASAGAATSAASKNNTKVGTSFTLGARAQGATSANAFNGRVYALYIWNRSLSGAEVDTAMTLLGQQFNITLPNTPTYFDATGYAQTFFDDFEYASNVFYETNTANDFGVMTKPWVPRYVTGSSPYGTAGALGGEVGWMVDPRDAAMAPYDPFVIADSCLKITPQARPGALSALSLPNGNSVETTGLTGAAISLGAGEGFVQQYGYWEVRLKSPTSQAGNFPAAWMLSATGRWPTEIDIYEMFGAGRASVVQPVLHSDQYWPEFSGVDNNQYFVGDAVVSTPDHTTDFIVLGVDIQPDYMKFYVNRELKGTMLPPQGIYAVAVAAGGTGWVASNGTNTGTLNITTTLSPDYGKEPLLTVTIVAGVATAVSVVSPGVRVPASPTWVKSGTGTGTVGTGYNFTLSRGTTDPAVPSQYHTPMYWLLNFGLGDFTGTPSYPTGTYQVDYVRTYRKVPTTPTILTGTQAEATAIINQMTSNGAAPSAGAQTAINDFVRLAKSWNNLRGDLTAETIHGLDWDGTSLSLWDALEGFAWFEVDDFRQAVNWKAPATALTVNGAPTFNAGVGYAFTGTVGQYIDTNVSVAASTKYRQYDNHMGAILATAPSNSTLAALMGAGANSYFAVSTTTHDARLNQTAAVTKYLQSLAPGASHLIAARGHRFQQQMFKDGEIFHAGYSGNLSTAGNGNMLIGARATGTAGFTGTLAGAHWGRRLMPEEALKLSELVAALRAAW